MSLQLYKIADKYEMLLSKLYDPETGEVNQDIASQLDLAKDEGNQKVISVASYIKNIEAERKAIEEAKKEMAERENKLNREVEYLTNYLKTNMERCQINEIKCAYFVVKLKKNRASVEDFDINAIPDEYKRTSVEVKPDKIKIRESLEAGVNVPGARLKHTTSLVIR